MGRDMAKKAVTDRASHKKIYYERGIRIRRDSRIPEALEDMTSHSGVPVSKYIVEALTEKLIRDGYLPAESQETEE